MGKQVLSHRTPEPLITSRFLSLSERSRLFADLGLPAQMPEGAASLYRFVEGTLLGAETPEQRQHGQTLEEVASILASALAERLPEDQTTS